MSDIGDIPELVLAKIEEYELLKHEATTVKELKVAIADAQFNKTVTDHFDEVMIRIRRQKADDAKGYVPTAGELIVKIQDKINSAILSDIEI